MKLLLKKGLIGTGACGLPVTITTKDGLVESCFQQTLVVRKGALQLVDTKQIGDGMEVVVISDKPFMLKQLRDELVNQAVLLYREYDEETDQWTPYVYQFPKDQELLDEMNEMLPEGTELVVEEKYVRVVSADSPVLCDQLQTMLMHNAERGVLSFLYGLSLVYGQRGGEGERLMITVPLQGSVVQYGDLWTWLQTYASNAGWMIRRELHDVSLGQQRKIEITDWTVLTQFAYWQGVEDALPGRERATHYHDKLLPFVRSHGADEKVVQSISKGVLKLYKK